MKRTPRLLLVLIFVGVIVAVTLGVTSVASAWSEGTDPNGLGTHDWILKTANQLAGGWVDFNAAQPYSDDPDTVYKDTNNHIYDNWGLLRLGNAPNTVKSHYAAAVAALKAGNLATAYKEVAVMGHYYEDVWNPWHTTYELSNLGTQAKYHSKYENDVLTHEPLSVTGFTAPTGAIDPAAWTITAASTSRGYYSILANAYIGKSGYAGTGVDSTTKDMLTRAAKGLAALIYRIKVDAGK
jgi:hypothetical protein